MGGETADLTTQAGVEAAQAIFVRHYSGDVVGGVYSARAVQQGAQETLLVNYLAPCLPLWLLHVRAHDMMAPLRLRSWSWR